MRIRGIKCCLWTLAGDLTITLGWTDADNLSIILETQMEKTISDEPFVYSEGILYYSKDADMILTSIELYGMEMTLVNVMIREFTMKSVSGV